MNRHIAKNPGFIRSVKESSMIDALQVLKLLEAGHSSRSGLAREKSGEERAEAQVLWGSIQAALASEHEQRLAYLLYNCALTPMEILHIFRSEERRVGKECRS